MTASVLSAAKRTSSVIGTGDNTIDVLLADEEKQKLKDSNRCTVRLD